MSPSPQREEELFAAALALPAAERAGYLERECGGDSERRRRVEALLHAHETIGGFLEKPAEAGLPEAAHAAASKAPEQVLGTKIGRYKLLEKIGEGGCGVVYLAEQKEPIHRRVALKVIKLGMDTQEVIARFEAERQALALMDHPNIAKVLDAGTTESGRPYFVMELVRGIKITAYCDQHNLSMTERLQLFTQVCHAIQHAHQKGIIHRDIKPSNILVTLQDGEPVPKVIDFGIAKATQGRLTDQTLFTAFEQFIGTPAYMSPEQAELTGQDIDTRSDIYSLGVLLYELLTGRTPFETKDLLRAGLDEMRRQIREVEPPKPSTRLSTLEGEALASTAQHRATAAPKLIHLVRGDLDWIVMRCLEKNRARRYETANGLADDILRHLHDQPIAARPPSRSYRLGRLLLRNRRPLALAATALVLGIAVGAWLYLQERAAKERALTLTGIPRAAEDLDAFIANLKHTLSRQPNLAAAHLGLGVAQHRRGDLAGARTSLDTAVRLDPKNPEAWQRSGELRVDQRELDGAVADFSAAIQLQPDRVAAFRERGSARRLLGDSAGALADFSRALELRPDSADIRRDRASVLLAQHDYAGAAGDYTKLLESAPNDAELHYFRAFCSQKVGRVDEAVKDLDQAIAARPDYTQAWQLRGRLKLAVDFDGAVADLAKATALQPDGVRSLINRVRTIRGGNAAALTDLAVAIVLQPKNAELYSLRAGVHANMGDYIAVVADYDKVVELKPDDASALFARGNARLRVGEFTGAIADFTRVTELTPGDDKAYFRRAMTRKREYDSYTITHRRQQDLDALGLWGRQTLDRVIADLSKTIELNPESAQAYAERGGIRRLRGEFDLAIADFTKAIELVPGEPAFHGMRARARRAAGDEEGARADETQALGIVRKNPAPASDGTPAVAPPLAPARGKESPTEVSPHEAAGESPPGTPASASAAPIKAERGEHFAPGSTAAPTTDRDSVRIIDVKTTKASGSDITTFRVRIGYSLIGKAHGVIMVGFDENEPRHYFMKAQTGVEQGTGEVELVAAVNVANRSVLTVYSNLSEDPHPSRWNPLASDTVQVTIHRETD